LSVSKSRKISRTLFDDFEKHIADFPGRHGSIVGQKYAEMDRCGTSLWNLSTTLRRSTNEDESPDFSMVLLMTRVYAFLMIDYAYNSGDKEPSNLTRVMKLGLKTAKNCLGTFSPSYKLLSDRKQAQNNMTMHTGS
jgi:hypothetical protein